MSTEQPTPETDAALIRGQDGIWDIAGVGPIVRGDFARTLELQRDAARAEATEATKKAARYRADFESAAATADKFDRESRALRAQRVTETAKEIVELIPFNVGLYRKGIESILSRLTSQPTTGQLLGANLRLQQELADWMKIAEMEGEKRESLEEILGARQHELRELRAECERFREKLREILLAANLEQQTEGVVQPFVAKWIRKRTAERERLRKALTTYAEHRLGCRIFTSQVCSCGLDAAMQPSPKSPLDEPAKH